MTSQASPAGPGQLVKLLTGWATDTAWVEWLELGGSLGRGAGDAMSDIDAGIGVTDDVRLGGEEPDQVLDEVQTAVTGFAPVAAVLRQQFGPESTHLVVVYQDGRQLSLVVMPATRRSGLPPQALVLVDKAGRLAAALDRGNWDADVATRREWTFLACIAAGDALKHAARGRVWRALRSLNEARDMYLQLLAARAEVIFPQFGAVSLENAGEPISEELAATLVSSAEPAAIAAGVRALVGLLEPFVAEHDLDQLLAAVRPRLRADP